ncbi:MAG: hypothetical protein IKY10_00500, partial [Clostridia bacterium]|nr:hypothetical protein [Clostridia bacterium]
TEMGEYVIALETNSNAILDESNIGNTSLLEGYKYVGGVVGVALNSTIRASYAKVGIVSGETVGGLIGLAVSCTTNFSYAIPYINSYENYQYVGGLIGSVYGVETVSPERNSDIRDFESLIKYMGETNKFTDVQFTYSTLLVNKLDFATNESAKLDYVSANYKDLKKTYMQSNSNASLTYVYAGVVSEFNMVENLTQETSNSRVMELYRLFNVKDSDQIIAFEEVFSGWSVLKYWSLNEKKYFPLLVNETVDNYIDIDDQTDLDLIRANPNGKFRIVKSFPVDASDLTNWVIQGSGANAFTGTLLGESKENRLRPIITIEGLNPEKENASAGFFEQTKGATISNVEFEWKASDALNPAINVGTQLTVVSGLTCDDTNSLITNVVVRASAQGGGYFINTTQTGGTISGFGGIVGISHNTNILGSTFIGKVSATIKDSNGEGAFIGGIAANIETDLLTQEGEEINTAVINNSFVGSSIAKSEDGQIEYPTTEFSFVVDSETKGSIYVGGIVGRSSSTAIAACSVGGVHWAEGYEIIPINVELNDFERNAYIGGAVGLANNGLISGIDVVSNLKVCGNVTDGQFVNVGGLAGSYSLSAASELSAGMKNCSTTSTIDAKELETQISTHVRIAMGVAELSGSALMKQCLLDGTIDTEESEISVLYAGGAAAYADAGGTANIEEVISNVIQYVGSSNTTTLYAGGLVGYIHNATISYSASWQRIIPITHSDAENIYVGGLIGYVMTEAQINNSYTLSSIVADSVAAKSIQHLSMGALIGRVDEVGSVETNAVYYSSDYGLFPDENYVGSDPIGKNLSAQTLIYGASWHADLKTENGQTTNIWKTLTINGKTRLPYLETLEEDLKMFEIIGTNDKDYVLGSAMRPNQISTGSTYSFDQTKYQYYLIVGQEGETTPTFDTALNGVLIGQECTYSLGAVSQNSPEAGLGVDGTHAGVIPEVLVHSAVSNIHIKVPTDLRADKSSAGLIVGLNKGVVFNCSVQGTGVNAIEQLGLITFLNLGMVSYSHSSIEILESSTIIGGIVYTNRGKLLSNYFTGYINASTAAGIVVYNDPTEKTFVYNNYMAGVIERVGGENNFSFQYELTDAVAANNFIDSYSDVRATSIANVLECVQTAKLMSKGTLSGSWYYTVDAGRFVNVDTFGYNYNYPIYRFNKLVQVNDQETKVQDCNHQLFTGTGEIDGSEDTNGGEFTHEDRYAVLTSAGSKNYQNAFKIPHFGVLTSVQGLLQEDKDFNYVVIYDLNAKAIDAGEEIFTAWSPVGTSGSVNGFNSEFGFNGVFITNKFYAQTIDPDTDDDLCLISHLQAKGLFANIKDAYFADIKLGSFNLMNESGALGTNVLPTTKQGVVINNVSFVEKSVITGDDLSFYGGLFGEIELGGKLTIKNFKTSHGTDTSTTGSVKLQSDTANAGLLAGKSSGRIILSQKTQALAAGEYDASYIAWFDGNNYAGGIVGELAGGEIEGNGNIVNIIRSSEDDINTTNMLGGVAGIASGNPTVDGVIVSLYDPNGEIVKVNANGFGGIFAETRGGSELTVSNFVLQIKGTEIEFDYQNDAGQNNFYGLVVADHQGSKINVSGFELKTEAEESSLFYVTIVSETKNYSETATNCGVGTLAGRQGGSLNISSYKAPQVQITGNGVPNVGAISGCYEGGLVALNVSSLDETKPLFIVVGTTNVGGLFGYCTKEISSIKSNLSGSIDFLNSGFAYSVVVADGAQTGIKHMNFGGLFGLVKGAQSEPQVSNKASIQEEPTITPITNYNTVIIGSAVLDSAEPGKYVYNGDNNFTIEGPMNTSGHILNVGGVAGKIANSQIENMANAGVIQPISSNLISDSLINAELDGGLLVAKAQNVGGVLGLLQEGSEIKNVTNTGSVYGYQNVGGIVGYVGNSAGMIISNDNHIILDEGDNIKYENGEVKNSAGTTLELNNENAS